MVASWLVRLSLDQAIRVQALVRDIAFCFWARHLTLAVPLSTQANQDTLWPDGPLRIYLIGTACYSGAKKVDSQKPSLCFIQNAAVLIAKC